MLLAVLLLVGSTSTQNLHHTAKQYAKLEEPAQKAYQQSYTIPVIKPADETNMIVRKGGVSITCSLNSFEAVTNTVTEQKPVPVAANDYPRIDRYQIAHIPRVMVAPERATFTFTITNHLKRVLKLEAVPIVIMIDGNMYDLPPEVEIRWEKDKIIQNMTARIQLEGPDLEQLIQAKSLSVFIGDVPIRYDKAGNIQELQNFEWTFLISSETKVHEEPIRYEYVRKKAQQAMCRPCGGDGSRLVACKVCDRKGYLTDKEGKRYKCYSCSGNGTKSYSCGDCSGRGHVYVPQSKLPKVIGSEDWIGWQVKTRTIPNNLVFGVMLPAKGRYSYSTLSEGSIVNYWHTSSKRSQQYYIHIKHDGMLYKFLPTKANGDRSTKLFVNFNVTPILIKGGRLVGEPTPLETSDIN